MARDVGPRVWDVWRGAWGMGHEAWGMELKEGSIIVWTCKSDLRRLLYCYYVMFI